MLWVLADRFVDEVIETYRSREQAERALRAVLSDEPEWEGMIEVIPIPLPAHRDWQPKGRRVRKAPLPVLLSDGNDRWDRIRDSEHLREQGPEPGRGHRGRFVLLRGRLERVRPGWPVRPRQGRGKALGAERGVVGAVQGGRARVMRPDLPVQEGVELGPLLVGQEVEVHLVRVLVLDRPPGERA